MEVLNISLDNNDEDTSQDELDEDYEILESVVGFQKVEGANNTIKNDDERSKAIVKKLQFSSDRIRQEFKKWERPSISEGTRLYSSSSIQEQPEPFQFFFLDSISTITSVKHSGIQLDPDIKDFQLHNVIRLFGVTTIKQSRVQDDDGFVDDLDERGETDEPSYSASVCCNVHGFLPYFYAMPTLSDTEFWGSSEMDVFINYLREEIKTAILQDFSSTEYHYFLTMHPSILRIEVLNSADVENEIYDFFQSKLNGSLKTVVLKVYCTLPRFIWKANDILDKVTYKECRFQCYESNINNNMRFLTHKNLPSCSWLELPAGKYFRRNDDKECPTKESYCQIELDVHCNTIYALPKDHYMYSISNSVPAIRVLSFDIEVNVSPNDLMAPKDDFKQIIQIGNIVGDYCGGSNSENSIVGKTVFVLGTCDEIPDAKVLQFYIKEQPSSTDENYLKEAEAEMLKCWRDFVIQMDPDIILGYNIKKFDLPYLLDRSYTLNEHKSSKILPFLGRMKKMKVQVRPIKNELKKAHQYDEANVDIQGRIIMDFYPILVRHERNIGKKHFTLSNVAKRFLQKGEEKQDVHYTEIQGLQQGNKQTRNRLAQYCLQDSMIPYLLLFQPVPYRNENIGFIELYFKKCHCGGTLLRYMLNKSISYNDYYKQVLVQKNRSVIYNPDTPSPKKYISNNKPASLADKKCIKKVLFGESQQGSSRGQQLKREDIT